MPLIFQDRILSYWQRLLNKLRTLNFGVVYVRGGGRRRGSTHWVCCLDGPRALLRTRRLLFADFALGWRVWIRRFLRWQRLSGFFGSGSIRGLQLIFDRGCVFVRLGDPLRGLVGRQGSRRLDLFMVESVGAGLVFNPERIVAIGRGWPILVATLGATAWSWLWGIWGLVVR